MISWVEKGVRIGFTSLPPLHFERQRYFPPRENAFLRSEVQSLRSKRAITTSHHPRVISRLGTAPKKNGRLRMTLDQRFANRYVIAPKFQYEDLRTVLTMLRPGDFMVSLDLVDRFHHVNVHPDSRPTLAFEWDNQIYEYNVLPFGLSLSPYVFTKIVRPAVQYLRAKGIRVVAYMDDLLIMANSRAQCLNHLRTTLQTLQRLGWFISPEKSAFAPSQTRDYLGFTLCTMDGQVSLQVQPAKKLSVLKEVKRLLRLAAKGPVPARRVARVAGLCLALARVVTPTKVLLRNVYACLGKGRDWNRQVSLSQDAVQDLTWWAECLPSWSSTTIATATNVTYLETDASNTGWGAVLGTAEAAGQWGQHTATLHINAKEMLAVLRALLSFRKEIRDHTVIVRSDNMVTVSYINRMAGRIPLLSRIARAIHNLCWASNTSITATHLPGLKNVAADRLSRLTDNYDWGLSPQIFRAINQEWGPHSVDRFAAENNHLLPRFNARWRCPTAEAVDAFSQHWGGGENNFINPPFRLLPQILRKIQLDKAQATIIAPIWPAQPWFSQLVRMATVPPARIRSTYKSFTMGLSGRIEPLRNPRWRLAAWRVSGVHGPKVGVRRPGSWWRRDHPNRPPRHATRLHSNDWTYGAPPTDARHHFGGTPRMWPHWLTSSRKPLVPAHALSQHSRLSRQQSMDTPRHWAYNHQRPTRRSTAS